MLQISATQAVSTTVNGSPLLTLRPSYVRNAAMLIVAIAVFLQLVIFFSFDNAAASILLLCGAFVGLYYGVNRQLLDDFPLSTLAIIGYTTCHFVVPPLGKLADFQSILHGLNHPILVWVYGLIGMLALVLAHYVYRVFSPYQIVRWSLTRGFYRSIHFFDMPDQFQFWLMGIVGITATLVAFRHSSTSGTTTPMSSVARMLSPLIYTPYFTLWPVLLDPRYRIGRRSVGLGLIIYTVPLLAVSAMTNSRSFMLGGFASMACIYGYRVFTGTISPPKLKLWTLITIFIICWLISGPVTNLTASMLIVRQRRGTVSSIELARETWNVYRSGSAVKLYEISTTRTPDLGSYSEAYYNNIFLNRFGNMRFTDLSIDAAHSVIKMGFTSSFRKIEFQKVIAILPTPVIKFLQLDVNKRKALEGSSEDFLYELATGNPVGGFKTGEPLVILRVTFGAMWPIFFGIFSTFLFSIFDASCDSGSVWEGGHRRFDYVIFNPVIAGTLFSYIFYFAGTQDVASYVSTCTRGWIETGILYGVVFVLSKYASYMMFGTGLAGAGYDSM